MTYRTGLVAVALCAPLVLWNCSSSEAPSVPTAITISPGSFVFGALGRTQRFSAVVKDQHGNPMTGVKVAWSTTNGAVVTVDTTGLATAVANGTAQLTAASGSATQNAGITVGQVAAAVVKISGDAQSGVVGQTLANPLIVQVSDSTAHLISGATVGFAVTSGTGSVGSPSAATGANGEAQTTWTLGTTAGSQTVSASVAGAPAATFAATGTAAAAKSVAKQAGDLQSTTTGAAVPIPPAVIVRDSFNNAKAGVTVTFSAATGHGSVTGGTQTTNAGGIATVGGWSLGNVGTDTLTATVSGTGITGNPAIFTATSVSAGAPTGVAVLSGNNQPGLVGYGVNLRPAVLVTNASHNPVPNTSVTFAVTGGGGSVTGGTATTNANGIAQPTKWTLGGSPAVNTMSATVAGSGITGNPVVFSDTGVAGEFTILLQYYGHVTPTSAEQAAFNAAVAKWQSIIYRHYGPAVPVSDTANTCGAGEPALNTSVTDVLILASFDSIDGPGKTLAEAGPCFLRIANTQALVGIMKFDTADVGSLVSSGQLNEVVLHEMNHVLGFGTVWSMPSPFFDYNCLQLPSSPPGTLLDTYFDCANGGQNAVAIFDSIGGTSYTGAGQTVGGQKVPVENCANAPYTYPTCGAGTVNSHWRETVFGNELMTGYINAGTNPLSVLSVAAQQDLGYTVNYDAADPYSAVFTAPAAAGAARLYLGDDTRHGPMYFVDALGNLKAVVRR
ncbi:MAG TPA: hypothetical protein VEH83_01610 [Gemmatimonadales bacterium]|nr:hypothetical protein [Gemmatimonadales bacterium]